MVPKAPGAEQGASGRPAHRVIMGRTADIVVCAVRDREALLRSPPCPKVHAESKHERDAQTQSRHEPQSRDLGSVENALSVRAMRHGKFVAWMHRRRTHEYARFLN